MYTIQKRFRHLMGRFVTGVTVIAVHADDDVAAMTANAVTAVSLDPLLLLCCIRNESGMLPALLSRGCFSVNILASGQDDVSRYYGGQRVGASPARWNLNEEDAPLLEGANASFVCDLYSSHQVGDHTVVYGAIRHMEADDQPSPALVYAAGRYHDIALAA